MGRTNGMQPLAPLDKRGLEHFALLIEISRREEEESRWIGSLVDGQFHLVRSSVDDGRGA